MTLLRLRRALLRWVVALTVVSLLGGAEIDPALFLRHVKYLASEDLKGRESGSPGLEKAADYIADQFRSLGLKPVTSAGYYQPFQIALSAEIGEDNALLYLDGEKETKLRLKRDFLPLSFSGCGTVSGPLVFVGYGITANEYGYDDYAGVNVKGKIVIVMRHEPQEYDSKSAFAGALYTEHSQLPSKALNAKLHGALGVILVDDGPNHRSSNALTEFTEKVGPADAGVPFVQVTEARVNRWLAKAGHDLDDIVEAIDEDLGPRPVVLNESVRMTIDVRREAGEVHNVVGYLAGESPEYVILGAHYDHVGLGEQFSMAPSQVGQTHYGADDNASGTAGVIELARWFASQPKRKRGILFLAFAGEELGLLGSSFYANHPKLPIGDAVAMVNLDMIGRIRGGKVYVGGTETAHLLKPLIEDRSSKYKLQIDFTEIPAYGSSDHASFTMKQIPSLFFFSGLHGDYHRPSDTWNKINASDAATLLELVADVTSEWVGGGSEPDFDRLGRATGH